MFDWKSVPIPPDLAQRPKDARGFPVAFVAFVDKAGKPHLTIHDNSKVRFALAQDLCGLCGQPLSRCRWFLGGPGSAFAPDGAYNDPPMHEDCMHYALKVCPYLAVSQYHNIPQESTANRIDAATLLVERPVRDSQVIKERPEIFVAVKATRTHVFSKTTNYSRPAGKCMQLEYWQHGKQISDKEAFALIDLKTLSRGADLHTC